MAELLDFVEVDDRVGLSGLGGMHDTVEVDDWFGRSHLVELHHLLRLLDSVEIDNTSW